MNRTNKNWITQPKIRPHRQDDILTIEFPIPPDMKFRFLSVITFGNETELGKEAAKELNGFLDDLFKEFGEPWSKHPKIKIEARIQRPFVFERKMRMKNGKTAAAFYRKLSEKLNDLIPNGAPVLPSASALRVQGPDDPGGTEAVFYKKRPSQPPLDGIIIIQEDGGNGT